jgi:hypothetical protein
MLSSYDSYEFVCNICVTYEFHSSPTAFPPFLLRMTRPSKVVDPSPPRPFAERRCSLAALFLLCPTSDNSTKWWIVIYKGRWNMLEHDLCISLQIGDIPQRHLSADRWTSMDPTCRSQTCSFHNDVQLQHCFLSVSVCLSFASTSLVC